MIWALDLDDFTGGFCNEGKYPLFNTIVRTLWGDRPNPPTPAPTLPPTTRNPKDIDLSECSAATNPDNLSPGSFKS